MIKAKSHLTAIKRKKPSAPVRHLNERGLLTGVVLDYGCGRGFDCDALGCDGYDPHYRPHLDKRKKYDVIVCIYVLNVLPTKKDRDAVLARIRKLLKPDGQAYIAVRNDEKQLRGWTSRGTCQTMVRLDLPVVERNRGFVIYCLSQ